jgi:hypothetical protein
MTAPQADLQRRLDEAHQALLEACESTIAATDALDAARQRVARMEAELEQTHLAYTRSLSWRLTAPLRRANAKRNAIATRVHHALQRFPQVHTAARRIARALRLVPRRDGAPVAVAAPMMAPPPPAPVPMTESAQRLHDMIAARAAPPRKD